MSWHVASVIIAFRIYSLVEILIMAMSQRINVENAADANPASRRQVDEDLDNQPYANQ
jgi:hypothetical protein